MWLTSTTWCFGMFQFRRSKLASANVVGCTEASAAEVKNLSRIQGVVLGTIAARPDFGPWQSRKAGFRGLSKLQTRIDAYVECF